LNLAADATLDIGNNALVVDYAGTSPAASVRDRILAGRGTAGLGATWTGAGITSSAAAGANQAEPESRSVGYAENAALPLGVYTTFRGQAVDATSVLIAYTRTADANLDGVVNDDDVTVIGASYAPGAAGGVWALGDFEYDGFIDDNDVTLLGAFYNPAAAPLSAPVVDAAVGWAEPGEAHAQWLDMETSGQETVVAASTAGLPASGAVIETFGRTIVRGQETRAQPQWSRSPLQPDALRSGPEDRHELAPAVRPGFDASEFSRSEGPTPVRARGPDRALTNRKSNDESLIDLLAVSVASSSENTTDTRLAMSRDAGASHDDIWAIDWL
jgi:hypothetical protein